ncbi:MAG: phosphoglycerate mutase (2,3-diphosphoglycerate-independent), partial [Oscillibacter sp.]|nr:phosphoglycerate mutase (2,3-diphosphoglycerate-independent) [Oscillibacter sp.]
MADIKRGGAQLAEAVKKAYELGQDDYHLEPMVLVEDGKPVGKISDGDAVIFCCRRGEREIELTEMFTEEGFDKAERRKLNDLDFVIMTMYHDKFKDLPIAFAPAKVVKPLAQVLSEAG